jgi:hypothetical protein
MIYIHGRMDSRSVGNHIHKMCAESYNHGFLLIGTIVVILLFSGPVFGQLVVQPMRMDLTTPPSKLIKTAIEVQNQSSEMTGVVDMSVVELSQWEDGSWRTIEQDSGYDISKLSSCSKWIELEKKTVEVGPLQIVPVKVNIRVPPGTRGFYAAGIIAGVRPPQEEANVAVLVQFLVPVTIQIQNRPVRHQVELEDINMELQEAIGETPSTTILSMGIVNDGGTYSRLDGFIRVRAFLKEHWREITVAQLRPVNIIPGSELRLTEDIGRVLPPGKYKLSGALYVDGRRVKTIDKEIEFAGDPSVTKVATDVLLEVEPTELIITTVPGATRMTSMTVYNPADEAVNVTVALSAPASQRGVTYGELRGEDLNCTDWLEIVPQNFKMDVLGNQSLRITAKMPNPAPIHPSYYALLVLQATYPDGQNAGVLRSPICVVNKSVEADAEAYPMMLNLASVAPSKYLVVTRYGNFGDVHYTPRCRALVTTADGDPMARATLTSHKSGLMLPLEVRDFSGVIDFSPFPEGTFRLAASLEYAPDETEVQQLPIRVSIKDGQRVVEIIRKEEYEEALGVKW